jgi:hypothetical protein
VKNHGVLLVQVLKPLDASIEVFLRIHVHQTFIETIHVLLQEEIFVSGAGLAPSRCQDPKDLLAIGQAVAVNA